MREALVSVCRSPCCFAPISADIIDRKEDILWQGVLACNACGRHFPLQDGIAYLTVLDATWSFIFKELVNRRRIVQKELEGETRDRHKAELKQSQDEIASDVMETLFAEALKELPSNKAINVLDVGAGLCQTSATLAERGAEVVATETEIANLQYVSFEQTDPPEPESIEVGGKTYYRKNPQRANRYFSRFLCNAERLPFESQVFDVAFCRSVMHHVYDIRRVLQEMLRVVRDGGKIILCSEPIRSVLDREETHVCDSVDKIEGMNERRPTLAHYLFPLIGKTREITVQYWQSPFIDRSRKFFSLIGYDYTKHLRQGERLRGFRIAKLLPVNAAVNIFAVKKQQKHAAPRWLHHREQEIDVAKLVKLYTYKNLEEERRDFREKTGLLLRLRRELLALRSDTRTTCEPAKCDFAHLEKGWLGKARIARRWGRFTDEVAEAILVHDGTAQTLELIAATPAERVSASATIRVNGAELGRITATGREPHRFRLSLAHVPDNVLQVEIENDFGAREKEFLKGIWIHCIKLR
jgi:ubiquinone/menaquinone biosynthesis C-methylase UbiE/uncharacterized protein YbaR (Trm112 family)